MLIANFSVENLCKALQKEGAQSLVYRRQSNLLRTPSLA